MALSLFSKLYWLRALGYFGVGLNGILIPLLIFKLTGSATLAGISLLIEWTPKLGMYLFGGSVISALSPKRSHIGLEVVRIFAIIGLGLASLNFIPWVGVAAIAATYQCTNAISNILFETLVNHHWPKDDTPEGFASIGNADLLSTLIVASLAFVLPDINWLIAIALITQLATLVAIYNWQHETHPETVHFNSPPESVKAVFTHSFQALGIRVS